jgi:hypothetical protein
MFSFEQAEGKVRLISTWQSTYSGMIPDSFLQSLNVEQRTKNWIRKLENSTPRSLTIVAEVDGKFTHLELVSGMSPWGGNLLRKIKLTGVPILNW